MPLKDRTPMATALDLQELRGRASGGLKAYLDEIEQKPMALATLANELKAVHNALLAKLDADTGVADTNYAELHSVTSPDVVI